MLHISWAEENSMKQLEFLLDENISPLVKDHFESKGFKIEAVRDLMKGKTDIQIGEYAFVHNKVIITLDKDFGEIFFNIGISVILLRLKNALPDRIISILEKFFQKRTDIKTEDLPKLFVITEKKTRER
jgi:predicted nuclease of predicted toxin-antitoxin system